MQTHFPPSLVAASWQALGNGYRIYNPALMRFHGADAWSPFGRGGLNAYAYAAGDPVNHLDPSGHFVIHVPQLMVLIAAAVASLGAAGIAVNTTNDTQRVLSSVASVLAGVGVLAMGRHMYRKGRPRPHKSVEQGSSIPHASHPVGPGRAVETPVLVDHARSRRASWPGASPSHNGGQMESAPMPTPRGALGHAAASYRKYGWSETGGRAPTAGRRGPGRIWVVYAIRGEVK